MLYIKDESEHMVIRNHDNHRREIPVNVVWKKIKDRDGIHIDSNLGRSTLIGLKKRADDQLSKT